MSKRIIYKIKLTDIFFLTDRPVTKFLNVQEQNGVPVVWVEVDGEREEKEIYSLSCVGTGYHYYAKEFGEYLGTWQEKETGLVYHFFARKYSKEEEIKYYTIIKKVKG